MKMLLRALRAPLTVLVITATLVGCGLPGSDRPPTSTPAAGIGATATTGGATTGDTRPSGSFTTLTQVIVLGGCRVTLPLTWISFGDGSGETASGARFTLYGGNASSDADWARALQLVVDQAAADGATVTRGPDWVLATAADDRGFTFRLRTEGRYCDIAVTAATAIPADEREVWPAVIGALQGAPETLPTATVSGG